MAPSVQCLSTSSVTVLVESGGNSAVTAGLAKVIEGSWEGLRSRPILSSVRKGSLLF